MPLNRWLISFAITVNSFCDVCSSSVMNRCCIWPPSKTSTNRICFPVIPITATCFNPFRTGIGAETTEIALDCTARIDAASFIHPSIPCSCWVWKNWCSIILRFSSDNSCVCISVPTKYRYPFSVGTLPAEVCGWRKKFISVRAANSFRTVAGLKSNLNFSTSLLEPTGLAVFV